MLGKINLITPAEVTDILGDGKVEAIEITKKDEEPFTLETDHFIPLFGFHLN